MHKANEIRSALFDFGAIGIGKKNNSHRAKGYRLADDFDATGVLANCHRAHDRAGVCTTDEWRVLIVLRERCD